VTYNQVVSVTYNQVASVNKFYYCMY